MNNIKLKAYFVTSIIVSLVSFVLTVAYTTKYEIKNPNVILERYGILLTLVAIPLALKHFHNQIKKQDKTDLRSYVKKYQIQYLIRLAILLIICFFNIVSLYITGSKNFYFMVIVSIFAYFLCAPQKTEPLLNEEDSEINN